jgi:intracellular sulfur oxidation DsrE/DsrF family protein
MFSRSFLSLSIALFALQLSAAEPTTGPIIDGYGASFAIPDADVKLPADHDYRVVWEITTFPDGPGVTNRSLEFVARFLNVHGKAGVPVEKMHLAVVAHGAALKNMINDEAYERDFEMKNPNRDLVQKLLAAGVQIYVCGQSMGFQGRSKSELQPGVKLAPSAMTMMHLLQDEGYTLQ